MSAAWVSVFANGLISLLSISYFAGKFSSKLAEHSRRITELEALHPRGVEHRHNHAAAGRI